MKIFINIKHNKNNTIKKFSIVFGILILLVIVFNGCASFKDPRKYEMKKSPCSCNDKEYKLINQYKQQNNRV